MLSKLPVTVVGIELELYSTLGGTHHTMEDVAVTCAIPNMQVIAPVILTKQNLLHLIVPIKKKDQFTYG